jgi:Tol biopolymer transport system component
VVAPGAAGCLLLISLSACTLLGDPFEPALLPADAGLVVRASSMSEPASEAAAPPACTAEGLGGSARGAGDSTCASAIGLLDPGELFAAALDAGASPELAPSLSQPPCTGDFGPFGAPERIADLDFDGDVFGPSLSADGRTLFFSAYVAGQQRIYSATRSARGSSFSDVTELPVINTTGREGTPFISANAERFYFFSERDGGPGNRDIWVSQLSGEAPQPPELVRGVNSRESDLLPWLSTDELTLLFVSSRPGGRGSADLWRTSRSSLDAAFEPPVNLFELSSGQNEGRVVLSANGLTAFFSSDREGGRGSPDLWMASRRDTDQPFSGLVDLWPLNTNRNEQDVFLSSDETELFFASNRRGAESELWRAARTCS